MVDYDGMVCDFPLWLSYRLNQFWAFRTSELDDTQYYVIVNYHNISIKKKSLNSSETAEDLKGI